MTTGAKIHLVGRLTAKRRVGKATVVFLNVERHESVNRLGRVKRVQVEPLMFERSPPRLDQGIGESDLGLRQDTPEG